MDKVDRYFLNHIDIRNMGVDVEQTVEFEDEEYLRCSLVEKFLYTYITYHTCYRKFSPEDQSFSLLQMRMIGALRFQKKCSLKKLCAILYMSHSNGSIMVEKLVKQGLVCRAHNNVDRRKVLLSLTPKGAKVADALWRKEITTYYEYFKIFTEEEMRQLSESLDTMERLLGKVNLSKEED